jgi:hypothetical protein
MSRHVIILKGEPVHEDDESGSKLCKDVYDAISDKTVIAATSCQFGQAMAVLIIYDDVE